MLFAADRAMWALSTEFSAMSRTHTMIAKRFGSQRLHTLFHGHLLQCITLLSVVSTSAIVTLGSELLLLLRWRVDELVRIRRLFFGATMGS